MANLLEAVRAYSVANGGHAANAATAGVSLAHFVDVVNGRQPISSKMAATMAPLVGTTVTALMREDQDRQLLTRRNTAG